MTGISEYIVQLQGVEQYAFSWSELQASVPKTHAALKNELARLVKKKEIITLRTGFYIIIPPRYRAYGKLPVELYIEKLFSHLSKPYYLAFYSAAIFYGASHQRIQHDYLVTQIPNLPDIKKGPIHLKLFATSVWPSKNIIQKKSDAGYFKISSPILTSADFIHYQTKVGGINKVYTILQELAASITLKETVDFLNWYPYIATIQRLGYLLEVVNVGQDVTEQISSFLNDRKHYPVLLSPGKGQRPGRTGNRWKVDVNVTIESDL